MPKSLRNCANLAGLALLLAAPAAAYSADSFSNTPRTGAGYSAPLRAQHAIRVYCANRAGHAAHADPEPNGNANRIRRCR